MTPTTNHELLEEYIDAYGQPCGAKHTLEMLREIQSRLIEPMEYEIGKEYEFSDDGEKWIAETFRGYADIFRCYKHIRPITPIPPDITSAITLLEQEGYIVTKK